jgi:membrane-associated phospholipid phosphatase
VIGMKAKNQVTVADGAGQRQGSALPGGRLAAPLLPAGSRRPTAAVGLCCLVLVITLGALSAHQSHGWAIDHAVDSWMMGLHIPSATLEHISWLGDLRAMTVLTGGLALACIMIRRLTGALLAVVGVLLASGLTEAILKPLVHRTIGASHYLTYPSGHTTGLFALSTALAVVLLSTRSGRPRTSVRIGIVAVAVLISCSVGMAMVGRGFHYFTDTVGGAAVGTGVVLGLAFLLDVELVRRWLGRISR